MMTDAAVERVAPVLALMVDEYRNRLAAERQRVSARSDSPVPGGAGRATTQQGSAA